MSIVPIESPGTRGVLTIRQRQLVKLARARLKSRKRIPPQKQPDAIRLAYLAAIRKLLARARELVRSKVLPMLERLIAERGDSLREDAPKDINHLLDRISEEFFRENPNGDLEDLAHEYAQRTSRFQKEQLAKQMKSALGIDPFIRDAGLAAKAAAFVAENVALIKSIPERYFSDIEAVVLRGVRSGARASDIAAEMQNRYGVSESRATLIARDQVGKFYGELQETRQTELGIEEYRWENSGDERVRPEHVEREGKVFRWDEPPEDGHPGQAIQCRCSAIPILDNLLAD